MGTKRRQAAVGLVDFDCDYCRRPGEYTGLPTVEDDGHTLLPENELWEAYNLRRYEHYERDFPNAKALREHLEQRIRYWMPGAEAQDFDSSMHGIDASVDAWQRRRQRKLREQATQPQFAAGEGEQNEGLR